MKKIVFMFIPLLITILAFSPIGSFTVHGIVKDDKGTIPYATVMEKGTKNVVTTDAAGAFTIQVTSEKATLVITAIGYTSKEIKLKGRSKVDIALNASETSLNEVVVVGYGTVRKKDL